MDAGRGHGLRRPAQAQACQCGLRGSSGGRSSAWSAGADVVRAARKRLLVRRRPGGKRRALPLLKQPEKRAAVAACAQLRWNLADHACETRGATALSASQLRLPTDMSAALARITDTRRDAPG